MKKDKIRSLYFKWLLDFVCSPRQKSSYSIMLNDLFEKEFIWLVEYDENLANHGLRLREDFYNSSETVAKMVDLYGEIDDNCSVLEMLVSLSISCETTIMSDGEHDRTKKWFWIMIRNLKLDIYDNMSYDEGEVNDILDIFLLRKYDNYGNGNIFKFEKPSANLPKIDIWMQLNQFLIERFE